MVKKIAYIALAGIAAAGGVFLGWKVTATPMAPKAAMISSALVQTAALRETPAAQADRPDGRMEPSVGEAESDRPLFRLDTPTTQAVIDPAHGKASLTTPLGSISMDTEKREARIESAPLQLGIGWWRSGAR